MNYNADFPAQKLSFKAKGKKWGEQCVDWGASRTYFNFSPVRSSVVHMKINYDLVNGIIHMDDVARIINPGNVSTVMVPDKIQHYPIINSKLNTLRGEEGARVFDWRLIVTNPNAISEMEQEKRRQFDQFVQQVVENPELDDIEANRQLQEGKEYFDKEYQDIHEKQANELLHHYSMEQNFKQIFNDGFMDACIVGMEAYYTGIKGGEPYLERLNPLKLRCFRSGYSDKIEDCDVIIYEDYWSRSRIIDTYYDELSSEDVKWLMDDIPADMGGEQPVGPLGNVNDAYGFVCSRVFGEDGIMLDGSTPFDTVFDELSGYDGGIGSNLLPYDVAGNVRVLRMWWTSVRKIYIVKSYDPETGDEVLDFYPETYVPDKDAGEEATPVWVNEKWEGTLIGNKIHVGIRPCLVQHNSISNPSRCHAGIIGTIYNLNESRPYSLVDMMKPYNYLYDAVHAKLVELIATNWGKILELDLAMKPKDWKVEQWLYFARVNKALIKDSFNEGGKGAAMGKLAGGLNNATKGYIDADWGQSIQNYIEILKWTLDSMSNLVGINRQREGNTYNRETMGGIERAVLQSSYITDWLFQKHEDTKRRTIDAYTDEAKAAIRGRSKKFQYILSDGSLKLVEVDGDEFAARDYGIVADSSSDSQKLAQQIESIGQAGIQNGELDFPTLLKLYTSCSLQEKIRIVDMAHRNAVQRAQEAQQQENQLAQQKIQAEQQAKQLELQQKDMLNQRDNDTKIEVAKLNAQAEYLRLGIYADENSEELRREELEIQRDKLREEMRKLDAEIRVKEKDIETKKEIEMKKLEAQKTIARNKAN